LLYKCEDIAVENLQFLQERCNVISVAGDPSSIGADGLDNLSNSCLGVLSAVCLEECLNFCGNII